MIIPQLQAQRRQRRPRCATSRSAPDRVDSPKRQLPQNPTSPSNIARRPRRPRTTGSRALRPRSIVIKRPRLGLRHRRIERIRRPMRTARRIVRPLRCIRTATSSRPRAVRAQVFIPVLLALLIPGHCATQAIAPARAERDAVRRQDEIGFTPGRSGQRRHQRVARHPQRPRIRRIERATFGRRSELHPSAAHPRRMPVIPSSRTPLRAKHVRTGRPIGQRIASRGMGGRNRKRARDRGGGREADGAIHGRSEAGDVH